MIRFTILLAGITALIGACGLAARHFGVIHGLPTFFIPTLVLLAFTTSVIYVYLDKSGDAIFVQLYLLTIAVKILAYGAYVFIMAYKDQQGAFMNVVFFLVIYFLFTALEIAFLYRKKTHS